MPHVTQPALRIAIQGELGSNSHMAALAMLNDLDRRIEIVPCAVSAIVFERLLDPSEAARADAAVLPIENSLHGSVAEHYDLLLAQPVRILRESLLRIRFNLIAMPGVQCSELRRVLSHPVALAQCRRFLAAHRELEAVNFYDTAGSVKHLMEQGLRDTAGIAPELAAAQYGAQILETGLEDHAENFTRFHLVCREEACRVPSPLYPFAAVLAAAPNKMTLAFSVEHRPGSLVEVLQLLAEAGVDLTRIESRPVPGSPWEYVFYIEFRFAAIAQAESALAALEGRCRMVRELGRYTAAS
jgi:prephenate dehydratase